uniref:BORCS6 domain-containing protein n=1 Tax=Syphacia muris TaxID=451379 RepID=A0A0N5AXD9_9BILA
LALVQFFCHLFLFYVPGEVRRRFHCTCSARFLSNQISFLKIADVFPHIESDAKAIASNLDEVLRDLRGSLHGMSDLTVESSRCYAETISSTCDAADAAVKNTYALLAKVEELSESMSKLRTVAQQIREIKQVVDSFEVQFISGLL